MHACVLCGTVPKREKKKLELHMFVGTEIEPGWNYCPITPIHLFSPLSASLVVPITGVMSLCVPKTMPAISESIIGRESAPSGTRQPHNPQTVCTFSVIS